MAKGRPKDPNLTIREMRSFRMDLDLYIRCQAACYALRRVFTTEMELMMTRWLRDVQREHNHGQAFEIPETQEFQDLVDRLEERRRERQEI